MNIFARITGGVVVELIPATETPIADRFHPDIVVSLVEVPEESGVTLGWAWDGKEFVEPSPPEEPPPRPMRKIAALAFRRRLGPERLAAITIAAGAALRADPPDATLQVMLDNLTAARFVVLDDPETIAGLQQLRDAGLLDEVAMAAALADGQPGEEPS